MKYLLALIALAAICILGSSCQKEPATSPTPSQIEDSTDFVDSMALLKEYYINNRSDLFIMYDPRGEHKADSAFFDTSAMHNGSMFVYLNTTNHDRGNPLEACDQESCVDIIDPDYNKM